MNDYISRLTLRLPKTLHQQLINLAQNEAISLNQYIINALTCQVNSTYRVETISKEDVEKQQDNFNNLIAKLELKAKMKTKNS
ncbi:MAG: toxin-antitoxin system HicB family antitoxin [Pleurocapsa sp. MO_226.B13]|nr:toxin-antitoxin system HicB family antitoxin [Pleurocapsa sp. MO_226.B13]